MRIRQHRIPGLLSLKPSSFKLRQLLSLNAYIDHFLVQFLILVQRRGQALCVLMSKHVFVINNKSVTYFLTGPIHTCLFCQPPVTGNTLLILCISSLASFPDDIKFLLLRVSLETVFITYLRSNLSILSVSLFI